MKTFRANRSSVEQLSSGEAERIRNVYAEIAKHLEKSAYELAGYVDPSKTSRLLLLSQEMRREPQWSLFQHCKPLSSIQPQDN